MEWYKTSSDQALDWPRASVKMTDTATNTYYANDTIPTQVINACIELAFKAARGELNPDLGQKVTREKIDSLEVAYDVNSPQAKRYKAIDNMLKSFLNNDSGIFRKVTRV